ncbi:MAG: hypothetical protein JZU52_09340 [Lamprocystis purpurea]|jgi:hypothetical protein|uniref:hypothetical protein n=1 Tax=Lamprocystis purpurea TaxID=61598 RepID=UPI00036F07D2|nr:hypothetical protein [Lamprocystis purpurea]MBV5273829.1 hypothetical protein [Lamprocystis purpurea]
MRHRALWVLAAFVAAALVGMIAVKLGPLLVPAPRVLAVAEPDCDLRAGPCIARFAGGGEVTLDLEPRGIPVIRPLVLRVVVRGLEVSTVAVDFAGVDMNMGYNRPSLAPVGSGSWRGAGMLPTCVRARMLWEAKVLLTTPRGLFAAPFRFETDQSGRR